MYVGSDILDYSKLVQNYNIRRSPSCQYNKLHLRTYGMYKDVDFKNNILDFLDFTQIIGKQTTATLVMLANDVKAHTQAVHFPR